MATQISTPHAPKAIGSYSQAIETNGTVYLSGQIPMDPQTMKPIDGPFEAQLGQVFKNLKAVCEGAGGSLADVVKLTIYIADLSNYPKVNSVMEKFFEAPYPARAAIGVAALPLGVPVEVDGFMVLGSSSDYSY
jgi:reactive intermediate/imine deaminase